MSKVLQMTMFRLKSMRTVLGRSKRLWLSISVKWSF